KFIDELVELRAISGHMLGAVGVQIPENNLDNLHSSREEDGTSKTMDLQDLLGSLLLADIYVIILGINAAGSSITAVGSRLMLLGKVDTAAELLKNLL
nr:hypothetical protein [Tanacetum cinerariifolium]